MAAMAGSLRWSFNQTMLRIKDPLKSIPVSARRVQHTHPPLITPPICTATSRVFLVCVLMPPRL